MYRLIFIKLLIVWTTLISAQSMDYYKLEISIDGEPKLKGDELYFEELKKRYNKEIFKSDSLVYYVKSWKNKKSIIKYDLGLEPREFYFQTNDTLYKNITYEYIPHDINDLSTWEQEYIKGLYLIDRDSIKDVFGFESFKVTLQNANVEMYVNEELPNMPSHFPLASFVLKAEPLEIKLQTLGWDCKVNIAEFRKEVDIEKSLGVRFEESIIITNDEYHRLNTLR